MDIECISKQCNRPLLSLTVADLGNEEQRIEQRLSTWFKLAESWKAIMLVDEADVFLEERVPGDLQRNCLVAGMSPPPLLKAMTTRSADRAKSSFGLWNIIRAFCSL